jgi:hypothetical protein
LTATTLSYCTVCDALPGECSHNGARYLDDVVYEREEGLGWKVPDAERDRWNHPVKVHAPAPPGQEPTPLPRLIVEVEAWISLDHALEERLGAAYERDPLKTTRLCDNIVRAAAAGSLSSPGGLLWKRLGEIGDARQ